MIPKEEVVKVFVTFLGACTLTNNNYSLEILITEQYDISISVLTTANMAAFKGQKPPTNKTDKK